MRQQEAPNLTVYWKDNLRRRLLVVLLRRRQTRVRPHRVFRSRQASGGVYGGYVQSGPEGGHRPAHLVRLLVEEMSRGRLDVSGCLSVLERSGKAKPCMNGFCPLGHAKLEVLVKGILSGMGEWFSLRAYLYVFRTLYRANSHSFARLCKVLL